MPRDNQQFIVSLFIAGLLLLALIICLSIYSVQGNALALPQTQTTSFRPQLTNSEILTNWLPPSSYHSTITLIDDYLQSNNLAVSSMSIKGDISPAIGSYNFAIMLLPQQQTHHISVSIYNLNGTLSTTVTIDGQTQYPTVPTSSGNGTVYNNFNNLISQGLTTSQASNLQLAFQKFDSGASTIAINADSVRQPPLSSDSTIVIYDFSVNIDGANYTAVLTCPSLSAIELRLSDPTTNKSVFDSGIVDQNAE